MFKYQESKGKRVFTAVGAFVVAGQHRSGQNMTQDPLS